MNKQLRIDYNPRSIVARIDLNRGARIHRYYAIGLGGNTNYTAYSSIYEVRFQAQVRIPAGCGRVGGLPLPGCEE